MCVVMVISVKTPALIIFKIRHPALIPVFFDQCKTLWSKYVQCVNVFLKENKHFIHFLSFQHTSHFMKKNNISIIVKIYLGKYNFSLDTFSTQHVFWRKWTFHSLFISVWVSTSSVSIRYRYIYFLAWRTDITK